MLSNSPLQYNHLCQIPSPMGTSTSQMPGLRLGAGMVMFLFDLFIMGTNLARIKCLSVSYFLKLNAARFLWPVGAGLTRFETRYFCFHVKHKTTHGLYTRWKEIKRPDFNFSVSSKTKLLEKQYLENYKLKPVSAINALSNFKLYLHNEALAYTKPKRSGIYA